MLTLQGWWKSNICECKESGFASLFVALHAVFVTLCFHNHPQLETNCSSNFVSYRIHSILKSSQVHLKLRRRPLLYWYFELSNICSFTVASTGNTELSSGSSFLHITTAWRRKSSSASDAPKISIKKLKNVRNLPTSQSFTLKQNIQDKEETEGYEKCVWRCTITLNDTWVVCFWEKDEALGSTVLTAPGLLGVNRFACDS